jgi:hypothetical protein
VGRKAISGGPGWDGTAIAFDLQAEERETVLFFVHRGFKQADEGYAVATTRWSA